MSMPRPLVTVDWLAEHLNDSDLVVADCRFVTAGDSEEGRRAHAEGHVPGALYFHLDEDLSNPMREHGGRHPLPDVATIAAKFGAAGIGPGVKVVAYDWTGEHAARLWFVLRWLGHDDVAVLDGGFRAWAKAGKPIETVTPQSKPRIFVPNIRPQMVASMEEVRTRSASAVVIDARAAERFEGTPHKLDAKQGHIPGAVNRPWTTAIGPDGFYVPADQQASRIGLNEGVEIIHQCGSGVTACVNLVAAELAGVKGTRLYVGSWTDWCSYDENPVEKP